MPSLKCACFALLLLAPSFLAPSFLAPQNVPKAIFTDPRPDRSHPARMEVLHIPTHGVQINGLIYTPSGQGPHPTVVLCHGFPGNEKNLDLAQAIRRAGWNAVTFNYRGSWGSPGTFRFAQNPEDTEAVLAFIRDPGNAAKLGVDIRHIVLAGHSMGGWVTALTAARDPALEGAILISAADMGKMGLTPLDKLTALTSDDMEALSGTSAESLARELNQNAKSFALTNAAAGLKNMPLLVLSANDGLAPHTDALVEAIRQSGGRKVKTIHADTDHGWSDRRIFLEIAVISWLSNLRQAGSGRLSEP